MAKNKAKPHLQNKSALFAAPDADARAAAAPQDRAHEADTLVAENGAPQNRRANPKGRKQSRGSDTGPQGRRRH